MARFLFYVLLIFALPLSAGAQVYYTGSNDKRRIDEIRAYSALRSAITFPPYGSAKVTELIAKAKGGNPDAAGLEALSLREQFTYNMIQGEAYSQNCSISEGVVFMDDKKAVDERRRIFAYVPEPFGIYHWSARQRTFFATHRDSVLALIRESTLQSGHMGANYKHVVVDLNAAEMIPFITGQISREPKDHDLLTVLMLLMKDASYKPFLTSAIYKKLYGDNASYRSGLAYSKANEELIISHANDFYQSQKG